MKLLFVVTFYLFTFNLFAHASDQINYIFKQNEDGPQLTIHFTPYAAFEFLKVKKPELNETPILKLTDHYDDFTQYFNETLQVKIGNTMAKFQFLKGDLASHDAELVFNIPNIDYLAGEVNITITSYTEIFKRVKNVVIFDTSYQKETLVLNNNKRTGTLVLEKNINEQIGLAAVPNYIWIGGGLLLIVSILLTIKLIFFKK